VLLACADQRGAFEFRIEPHGLDTSGRRSQGR
jgi:hypothetical protein